MIRIVFVQFITFGFACTPLYFVWEKVVGVHDTKSMCLRAVARLPVVIPIWFLAIIFPFFGPINSAVGALLVSFTVYIIPTLAHMLTYRSAQARKVQFWAHSPPAPLYILVIFFDIVELLSVHNGSSIWDHKDIKCRTLWTTTCARFGVIQFKGSLCWSYHLWIGPNWIMTWLKRHPNLD